jgi:O-antigen/teichoic acid export membrane protein
MARFPSAAASLLTRIRLRLLRSKLLRKLRKPNSDPGRERYRRAGLSASASLIQKGLTVIISFVSIPLTIHYLGAERYGVWLTISSLLLWMSLTDFGLAGNALVNVLSQADGSEDRRSAQEYTASAVWALIAISAALAVIAIASFPFISWARVFHVSTVSHHELSLACALTIGFFLVGLPMNVQHSIYCGYQDGYMSNMWGICTNLSSLTALVIVTMMHGGLPLLVLALSGTRCAVGAVNLYYMFFHRYRWLLPVPTAVRWHCVRRLFSLGSRYMVTQLGSLGMYQSQPMIITQIMGPKAVIIFVVAQKVITLPIDLMYMATVPFVPAFGEAMVRQDWSWIRRAYHKTTFASLAAGIPITITVALIAQPLIRYWAGPEAVPDLYIILWLCVYNTVGLALMATGQLLSGTERVNALAVSVSVCAISTIGVGILFCQWYGLSGVAAAMAISKAVTFWPIQYWATRKLFQSKQVRSAIAANEATL